MRGLRATQSSNALEWSSPFRPHFRFRFRSLSQSPIFVLDPLTRRWLKPPSLTTSPKFLTGLACGVEPAFDKYLVAFLRQRTLGPWSVSLYGVHCTPLVALAIIVAARLGGRSSRLVSSSAAGLRDRLAMFCISDAMVGLSGQGISQGCAASRAESATARAVGAGSSTGEVQSASISHGISPGISVNGPFLPSVTLSELPLPFNSVRNLCSKSVNLWLPYNRGQIGNVRQDCTACGGAL
jgi:hypothetical protein